MAGFFAGAALATGLAAGFLAAGFLVTAVLVDAFEVDGATVGVTGAVSTNGQNRLRSIERFVFLAQR